MSVNRGDVLCLCLGTPWPCIVRQRPRFPVCTSVAQHTLTLLCSHRHPRIQMARWLLVIIHLFPRGIHNLFRQLDHFPGCLSLQTGKAAISPPPPHHGTLGLVWIRFWLS